MHPETITDPALSVVIPSYNRRDCVLALLADLERQEDARFEVIVVDDRSPDDTVTSIRERFPRVRLLVNPRNGGPAVSRNRGIRAARGEFVVGLDSDVTLPDRRLLARVLETFAERPEATGLAFRLLRPDGVSDDAPRWWHPLPVDRFADRAFETSYFSGTAHAFRREPLLATGLYPERFYMHYEEVELAFRVLDRDGTILYRPDLKVLHHANPVSRRNEIQVYYKPRNQILLAVACLPPGHGLRYALPRTAFQFLKAVGGRHLGDFLRAMRDAAKESRAMRNERTPLRAATMRRITSLRRGLPS